MFCTQKCKYFVPVVCLLLQNAGLNDSANWPSLNKAADKVRVIIVVVLAFHRSVCVRHFCLGVESAAHCGYC